jgi:ketosteroid isomerase-like protein
MAHQFRPASARLKEVRVKAPSAPEARHLLNVQEQIEAIGRGDYDAALRQAHPDVEFRISAPREFPFVRQARGIDALRRAMAQNVSAIEDQRPEITNLVVQEDVLVMIGTERGRIRATGVTYHLDFVHRFTFADGALKSVQFIAARAT